eukprot:m.341492 g.341492  ORF g.341492 m.341492 type:complete len:209 (+) comp20611_c0_seq2:94-720(+)
MWTFVVVLSAVSAICTFSVSAQPAEPCNSPYKFGATQKLMDPHAIDVVSREFLITYDAEFKRVYRSEVELPNHEANRTYFDVLDLYNYQGGVYYKIDRKSGKCTKGVLDTQFIPHRVEENSTFAGEFTIGSTAQIDGVTAGNVEVQAWRRETDKYVWQGVFTTTGCIPVRTIVTDKSDRTVFATNEFYDVILGIPNPEVFIPPRQCPS